MITDGSIIFNFPADNTYLLSHLSQHQSSWTTGWATCSWGPFQVLCQRLQWTNRGCKKIWIKMEAYGQSIDACLWQTRRLENRICRAKMCVLLTSRRLNSPLPSSSAVKKAVRSCMMSYKLILSLAFYFLWQYEISMVSRLRDVIEIEIHYLLCDNIKYLLFSCGACLISNLFLLLELALWRFLFCKSSFIVDI